MLLAIPFSAKQTERMPEGTEVEEPGKQAEAWALLGPPPCPMRTFLLQLAVSRQRTVNDICISEEKIPEAEHAHRHWALQPRLTLPQLTGSESKPHLEDSVPGKLAVTLRLLALRPQRLEPQDPPVTMGLAASAQGRPGLGIWWLPGGCFSSVLWEAFEAVASRLWLEIYNYVE